MTVDVCVSVRGGAQTAWAVRVGGGLVGYETDDTRPPGRIEFCDYNFRENASIDDHIAAVRRAKPKYAVAPDIASGRTVERVLELADVLERHCEEVIIVPKDVHPDEVPQRYLLGLPMVKNFADADIDPAAFEGRRVHLLGGAPSRQLRVAREHNFDVVSLDTAQHIAYALGNWGANIWTEQQSRVQRVDLDYYERVAISTGNIVRAWNGGAHPVARFIQTPTGPPMPGEDDLWEREEAEKMRREFESVIGQSIEEFIEGYVTNTPEGEGHLASIDIPGIDQLKAEEESRQRRQTKREHRGLDEFAESEGTVDEEPKERKGALSRLTGWVKKLGAEPSKRMPHDVGPWAYDPELTDALHTWRGGVVEDAPIPVVQLQQAGREHYVVRATYRKAPQRDLSMQTEYETTGTVNLKLTRRTERGALSAARKWMDAHHPDEFTDETRRAGTVPHDERVRELLGEYARRDDYPPEVFIDVADALNAEVNLLAWDIDDPDEACRRALAVAEGLVTLMERADKTGLLSIQFRRDERREWHEAVDDTVPATIDAVDAALAQYDCSSAERRNALAAALEELHARFQYGGSPRRHIEPAYTAIDDLVDDIDRTQTDGGAVGPTEGYA